MTEMSLAAARFAEREFRVDSAMSKTMTVLSRNVLTFCMVTAIASLPIVLLFNAPGVLIRSANSMAPIWIF